jgi:hypothetical protein
MSGFRLKPPKLNLAVYKQELDFFELKRKPAF